MKKRILITQCSMYLGGAERALLSMLESFDYEHYDVDLFLYKHEGELMKHLPKDVNLLPEIPAYRALSTGIKEIACSHPLIAATKIAAACAARMSRGGGNIYDEIVEMCAELYRNVKVGLPWEDSSEMGALSYRSHFKEVMSRLEDGLSQGARLVCGGHQLFNDGMEKGLFMEPTLLADVTNDMRVAQEEIFGPILVAIKFKDEADVLRMANDSKYGLSGAVFTRDINRAIRVANGVETGRMWINAYGDIKTTGALFGGYKQSGIGREGHWKAFDHYTQLKSIVINLAE